MIKRLLFTFTFLFSMLTYSQNLVYKSNGNIRDTENNKISPDKVRALLAGNQKILADYNTGRSKKTAGNILLIGGLTLLATDFVRELYTPQDIYGYDQKKTYPSALTYIGVAAVLVAIPVKIGFSKKIRDVVTDYNIQKSVGFKQASFEKIEFITNSNGLGLRFTLN